MKRTTLLLSSLLILTTPVLAYEKGKVVLFGHGYMNLHIRRVLIKQGWSLHCKSNAFWGLSSLEVKTT